MSQKKSKISQKTKLNTKLPESKKVSGSLKFRHFSKPQKISAFLSFLILIIVGVLFIMPLLPAILYPIDKKSESEFPFPISYTTKTLEDGTTIEEKTFITNGNRLYIPQINIDSEILEGPNLEILDQKEGVWREPDTKDPESSGNMSIAGHRFQYLPPNTHTFYNLDKLNLGENINVYWQGKEYIYKITQIFEVKPNETWIKNSDLSKNEITLYTCSPLFTSTHRLVVKGEIANN